MLAVGGEGVGDAIAEAGLVAVGSADDDPVAVLQGYGFELTWQQLNEAAIAIQRGAHWVATNTDPTRPTERGLVPGNGAAVAAVAMAVAGGSGGGGQALSSAARRHGRPDRRRRPIFVGDRLDTDIAGARNAGLDSLLVLSGSHGPDDLLRATPGDRPTHIGQDLRALLDPPLVVTPRGTGFACGAAYAAVEDGRMVVETRSGATDLEALWAAAHAAWAAADQGISVDLALVPAPPRVR